MEIHSHINDWISILCMCALYAYMHCEKMYCNLNDDVECGCDRDRQDDGRFVCKVLIKKTGRKQKEVFGPRKKTKKEEYKKNHTQVIFVH